MLKSFFIAFSMYSKIPVPMVKWEEKNMRYVLVFFPFIGVVIAALQLCWWKIAGLFHCGPGIIAAILSVIPVLVSGGIHLDGFLDTMDALCSYQSKEEKLRIMKDPHAGAFAIISAAVWLVLQFGGMSEIHSTTQILLLGLSFVLSRTFSGLSLKVLPGAKKEGLAKTFSDTSAGKSVRNILLMYLVILLALMVLVAGIRGAVLWGMALLVWFVYRHIALKEFGGITGDLAGWYLTVAELLMLYVIVW